MSNSRQLGKYQLIAELARGGMGIVYLASSTGLGGFSKILVVKELKPELVDEANFLDMFLEEARLAAQLNHPNIVTTYEVGMDGKRPFIVMDYLEGQTFARLLKKAADQVSLPMQLRAIAGALDGLHYAHTRQALDGSPAGVVHRDISPQNIFVTYDGQVKVVDFGIAKATDTTIETQAGTFKGKPTYMSPQQLRGDTDARADVYSMGVILWESVSGKRMWPKKTDVEILTALLKGEIPSIDEAAPSAPAELRRIVTKATAASEVTRYQTARAFSEDLNAYLAASRDRTTLADFGEAIANAFADERQKVRRLIEQAVLDSARSANSASGGPARLPSIAPPSDDASHPSSQRSAFSGGPPSGLTPQSSSLKTPPAGSVTLASDSLRPRLAKGKTRFWLVAAVLVLLLGIGFAAKTFSASKSSKAEAAAVPPPATPPPPATQALPTADASTASAPTAAQTATNDAPAPKATPAATPSVRVVYLPAPVHTASKPAPAATTAATANPGKVDCDPPFYFEGSKKIFKPGCL